MKLKLALATLSLLAVLFSAQTTTNVMALGLTWTFQVSGTGVAEYSTEYAHTGTQSVKLTTTTTDDWARIIFPGQGETLSQVLALSYWSYVTDVDTIAEPLARLRPWIGIYLDSDGNLATWEYYLQAEPMYATATHDAPGNLGALGTWEYWDAYGGVHPLHWLSLESPDLPYDAPHLGDYIDGTAISYATAYHGTVSFASREYGSLTVQKIVFMVGYGYTWSDFVGYVDDVTINTQLVSFESPSIAVDIKPGSWPNPINIASKGVFAVAICGTEDFDVMTIDPATVKICIEGIADGVSPVRWSYEDVATPYTGEPGGGHELGSDGYLDLVLIFDTQAVTALDLSRHVGETIPLVIKGNLYVDLPIQGQDYVRILQSKGKGP